MTKGNYRGTAAEMIMYFLTSDYDVTCNLTNFEVIGKRGSCNLSTTTVKWNDYSFDLTTKHFNIRILAEDIIKHLSNANLDNFKYKPKEDTPMRMDSWYVLREKFGKDRVNIGWVYHYPSKDEWHLDIKLAGKDIIYIHKGNPYGKDHKIDIGKYFMKKYPEYLM